ncbi:uncharacterized protein Z518_04874 [Rhinocladiella mackenziei CBS 650.93]|uniref:Rhinocladiella mackenziei CBS 650.93 unplaced genomic scaffold supercont1.3, whole genome shotgun sequence n=1 Tax=Rhinocladiella mackenziei CBS 650.93 TaxID=1442369 RepID=A0A0D2H8V2_9EURO|nr:uncharacterized protein Z518_04874 [Rhinocladiella mackenziei CBS 650.93]KIX06898.1 hypothetical protein Z518_04874 [Rhinocladiella mackenziei CBS 650.93]
MLPHSLEEDLPELNAILAPPPLMATGTNDSLRRSPRKKTTTTSYIDKSPKKKLRGIASPKKPAPISSLKSSTDTRSLTISTGSAKVPPSIVDSTPLLPCHSTVFPSTTTSSNRHSPATGQRSLTLAHVDTFLLPLKATALEEQCSDTIVPRSLTKAGRLRVLDDKDRSMMSLMTETARESNAKRVPQKMIQASADAGRFVLKEARCNDDEDDSVDEDDEDEDTDLSGFIVDDDAELSYHSSSATEPDDSDGRKQLKNVPRPAPRRRLQRGLPNRRVTDSSDEESDSHKEEHLGKVLSKAFENIRLNEGGAHETREKEIEVIDLTSSPSNVPDLDLNTRRGPISHQPPVSRSVKRASDNSHPFDEFDGILKMAPPSSKPTLRIPSKAMSPQGPIDLDGTEDADGSAEVTDDRFRTPPATPSRLLSKPRSPSKLLSPSKRQHIPQSPHRQSMDAFWDHNVINEWNDEFSPQKAPATSPRKRGLARFPNWSDSEEEKEQEYPGSSDLLPSPCSSPRKSRSPTKRPQKEEKRQLLEEKRAALSQKKDFDARKKQLAVDLLYELDTKVANSQLGKLASSTGGVQIKWSKTLRSTAGRANWKRSVIKPSGSPVKDTEQIGPGVTVQHYATIELAEKIIDCEGRLVNTLAHEFCHLANFMISNVRDQPHGASFKKWSAKVTAHLRQSDVDIWRQVNVTTKHNYVINHKYLWVCIGRDRTRTMDFLNLDEDEGCGAEYGRHSKSIDTEKHRCGRCKGRLLQVRPRLRASPRKKLSEESAGTSSSSSLASRSTSASGSGSVLGSMIETVVLSD